MIHMQQEKCFKFIKVIFSFAFDDTAFVLVHCFSNFDVHTYHLKILLKCRFWFSGTG